MKTEPAAAIPVNPSPVVGQAVPRLLGHFPHHFRLRIHGGIHEPGSPLSDPCGLRSDVVSAARDTNPHPIGGPGGCFVSACRPGRPPLASGGRIRAEGLPGSVDGAGVAA